MDEAQQEFELWWQSLSPEVQKEWFHYGKDKLRDVFNSLKLFEGEITIEDIHKGDSDKLSKVYKKKLRPHYVNNQLADTAAPLNAAKALLLGLMPETLKDYSVESGEENRPSATREEAKSIGKDAEATEKDAKAIEDLVHEAKEEEKKKEDRLKALSNSIKDLAKDSTAPARKGDYKGQLEHSFDLILMFIGVGAGIFLSFFYNLWVLGIPLIIAGLFIGIRSGYFMKFVDSIIRPTGEFAISDITIAIFLFILGVVALGSTVNYMMVDFDIFQFVLIALINTVLLIYLWTGREKPTPLPPEYRPALPPGKEPLALPPGKEQLALPAGEERLALMEKKLEALEGKERKALEAQQMLAIPEKAESVLEKEAEEKQREINDEVKEEKREAAKLRKEVEDEEK